MTTCGTCGYEIMPCDMRGTTCGCAWADGFAERLMSAGRRDVPLVIITSTMPTPTWIRDIWGHDGSVLTESPPCQMMVEAPEVVDAGKALFGEGWPERWNAADANPIEDMKYLDLLALEQAMSPGRLHTYELQAAHYADAFDKLTVIVPAPTGKRYGPYEADPHTKGRRRRFRTQRKA